MDERGSGFALLVRWGHQAEIYESIQLIRMESSNTRKLFSLRALWLLVLGKIAFAWAARQRCRARLIQLVL